MKSINGDTDLTITIKKDKKKHKKKHKHEKKEEEVENGTIKLKVRMITNMHDSLFLESEAFQFNCK